MRHLVQPRSMLEIVLLPHEPNVLITNPTEHAIVVTIETPEVVAARPTMPPEFDLFMLLPQGPWMVQRDREIEQLQRRMGQTNEALAQERDRAQREQYLEYLNRYGNNPQTWLSDALDALGEAGTEPAHLHTPHERKQAQRKARALLLKHMTREQRKEFKASGQFHVKGSSTGAIYMIIDSGSVVRATDGHEFCLQVVGERVPREDELLARKILIECDEPKFLATANNLTVQRARVDNPFRDGQTVMTESRLPRPGGFLDLINRAIWHDTGGVR